MSKLPRLQRRGSLRLGGRRSGEIEVENARSESRRLIKNAAAGLLTSVPPRLTAALRLVAGDLWAQLSRMTRPASLSLPAPQAQFQELAEDRVIFFQRPRCRRVAEHRGDIHAYVRHERPLKGHPTAPELALGPRCSNQVRKTGRSELLESQQVSKQAARHLGTYLATLPQLDNALSGSVLAAEGHPLVAVDQCPECPRNSALRSAEAISRGRSCFAVPRRTSRSIRMRFPGASPPPRFSACSTPLS